MLRRMRDKIRSSYFYRLLFSFSLAIISVLALFALVLYITFGRLYQSHLLGQGLAAAEGVAGSLQTVLDGYADVLQQLAPNEQVLHYLQGDEDNALALDILRQMYAIKNSFEAQATLSVVRLGGPGVLTTGDDNPRLSGSGYTNWGVFRLANQNEGPVLLVTGRDAVLHADTRIALADAICDGGRCLGYLLIEVPRTTLASLIHEYVIPYNTDLLLADQNGTVVFHSDGASREGPDKLPPLAGVDAAWQGEALGSLRQDGYAYCRYEAAGLLVLVEVPTGITAQFNQLLGGAALFALALGALLSFALAWGVAQTVSRPVQQLRASMEQLRGGDLSTRVAQPGPDEIGQLGAAFNDMAARISQLLRNVEEKQASLRVAEAQALSLQVNPHFIYNTLELIRWSARLGRNDVVVNVAVNFGKLLRRILNNKEDLVTVASELELLHSYLEIQKSRYADRLQVQLAVDEELLDERLPKLLLQPLMENAIVHGLEDKPGVGHIGLAGSRQGEYLVFCISDDGVGMSEDTLRQVRQLKANGMFNIGLNNVQQRAVLYGDEHCGLTIDSRLGQGTTIRLTVRRQPPSPTAQEGAAPSLPAGQPPANEAPTDRPPTQTPPANEPRTADRPQPRRAADDKEVDPDVQGGTGGG